MALFRFGENVDGYSVRVLNEREVRAGAGILFFFAMIVFMNAWLIGNFAPLKVFVVAFFVDFVIRVLVNPRFSPSLILGRFFVRNQEVEYVGAPQKRFAWMIGLVLSAFMIVWLVVLGNLGLANLIICFACLMFLLFESAFGICIGCKIYPIITRQDPVLCAGGVCGIVKKEPIQEVNAIHAIVLLGFASSMILLVLTGVLV